MQNQDLLNLPLEKAAFSVVDVETTGLSANKNRVIEIALVKIENLKITDRLHYLINPQTYIPPFITSLTGISNDDVIGAPFFSDIVDEIISFTDKTILTAHNFSFDSSFLNSEFMICGREFENEHSCCTLKLARNIYPTLKSKSLTSVAQSLNLKNSNAHRALGDAEITAKVLLKMIKELREKDNIVTVSELLSYQKGIQESPLLNVKKELQEDFRALPNAPGIYYFTNKKDEIIYVGKAKSIRDRVKSYFAPSAPRKAAKIVKQAARLKHIITNSELTALLTEAETIKILSPKHNSQLKKFGNKYFIRITRTHSAPGIELTNHFDFDGNDYFGLFISRRKATEILEFINKAFAIRECSDKEFNKGKTCFLYDIHRCTAPCVDSELNKIQYFDELEKVYDFLYGKNQFALDRLLNKMKEYSVKEKFEQAAEIKELVDFILDQTHKSSILAEPVNRANVLFEINSPYENDYVLMIEGKFYIKKYLHDHKDLFEQALDDYYSDTIRTDQNPTEEDLEKMKITLNWLVKNRNQVRVFYLKDYSSKSELYENISRLSDKTYIESEKVIKVKEDPKYDYDF
ncbi:MAG TPA: exonuclease domain-containing protein [Ignavibacteriaceae bacterium]|nr:exonuclease domain-containing protein [Ignavibacteriaceae bacterium]